MPGKAKKGGKKEKGKGSKKDVKEDKMLERYKELKMSYLNYCKAFLTDPLPSILKQFEAAINDGIKLDHIILNSTQVKSSDVSSLSETFAQYEQLAALCFWTSQIQPNVLQLLV